MGGGGGSVIICYTITIRIPLFALGFVFIIVRRCSCLVSSEHDSYSSITLTPHTDQATILATIHHLNSLYGLYLYA